MTEKIRELVNNSNESETLSLLESGRKDGDGFAECNFDYTYVTKAFPIKPVRP